MYFSQPLRPPCVNTPADNRPIVNNTARTTQKKATALKGKPSVLKITDTSTKKTETYRSSALDTYDFGSWTKGAYEHHEVTVPGERYSGIILDKARNCYDITGSMEAYDSGSRLGGYTYSYNISILPIGIHVYSSKDDIIKDLQDGYFLEDYLTKNMDKAYCEDSNTVAQQLLAKLKSANPTEVKSFAQLQTEKKEQAEAEKRNAAFAYRDTLFKLSDDQECWIELSTGYTLKNAQTDKSLAVIDGWLSAEGLPDKTYKVEKIFGKPIEDFPVRAIFGCKQSSNETDPLLKVYGYADYSFNIGFTLGSEDISAKLGIAHPVYPVNIYMTNCTARSYGKDYVIKYGNTFCVPVVEQSFIDSLLTIKEIEHSIYCGVDTRLILNHPEFDYKHAGNKTNYYIFRGELWSVEDLLIRKIRTGIYNAAKNTIALTPAMRDETLDCLYGYRHTLQYNLKSDVFYFVMDRYMYSLNLNHSEEYDGVSALCYDVNMYMRGISCPIKRISCKPYKRHVNNVSIDFTID